MLKTSFILIKVWLYKICILYLNWLEHVEHKIKFRNNHKSKAWNTIGQLFWDIGHLPIREDKNVIKIMLKDVQPNHECCVIGASAVPLIQEMIESNLKLSVLDFSKKMCIDLKRKLKTNNCNIKLYDIINPSSRKLEKPFQYILADQLINCFSKKNVPIFFRNISKLLLNEGELRVIVKLGLYEIDEALLAIGKVHGTIDKFFDEKNRIINYSSAAKEFSLLLENHPDKDILFKWYINRGEEMRFNKHDITEDFVNSKIVDGKFKIIESIPLPKDTIYFRFKWMIKNC